MIINKVVLKIHLLILSCDILITQYNVIIIVDKICINRK